MFGMFFLFFFDKPTSTLSCWWPKQSTAWLAFFFFFFTRRVCYRVFTEFFSPSSRPLFRFWFRSFRCRRRRGWRFTCFIFVLFFCSFFYRVSSSLPFLSSDDGAGVVPSFFFVVVVVVLRSFLFRLRAISAAAAAAAAVVVVVAVVVAAGCDRSRAISGRHGKRPRRVVIFIFFCIWFDFFFIRFVSFLFHRFGFCLLFFFRPLLLLLLFLRTASSSHLSCLIIWFSLFLYLSLSLYAFFSFLFSSSSDWLLSAFSIVFLFFFRFPVHRIRRYDRDQKEKNSRFQFLTKKK